MVIEIDIKIEDSDGRVLHRFENKFDEQDRTYDTQEYDGGIDMDFDEFLSEYLSYSGYLLREKLFSELGSAAAKKAKNMRRSKAKKTPGVKEAVSFEDSELEYRIRIGDNKVLIGKIPLKLEPSTNNVKLLLCSEEDTPLQSTASSSPDDASVPISEASDTASAYPAEECSDPEDYSDSEAMPEYSALEPSSDRDDIPETAPINNEEAVLDTILNFAMLRAIEKYESNLSPGWDEMDLAQVEPD